MGELTLSEWLQERLDNCNRIAALRTGSDREKWLEDARYFTQAVALREQNRRLAEALREEHGYRQDYEFCEACKALAEHDAQKGERL